MIRNMQGDNPVIIIAAARSGTKLLRSILSESKEFISFPYDINHIWKYGNYHIFHDELKPSDLTDRTSRFIKKEFMKLLLSSSANRVIEKSVSNSLRVDFVKSVFPNCKIIHLVRDGRDVSASARLCWQSPVIASTIQSKRDFIKKLINFPYLSSWRYLYTLFKRNNFTLLSRKSNMRSWGPRFMGMADALKTYSILEVCGIQWSRSISLSLKDLSHLKDNIDYITIKYEDLVHNCCDTLDIVGNFLEIPDIAQTKNKAISLITDKYIDNWRKSINDTELDKLMPHIKNNLKILKYLT